MVRDDIFSGLKQALLNGEPLKKAMMSFYRAGYHKEEIEEAAREIQAEQMRERIATPDQEFQEKKKERFIPEEQKLKTTQTEQNTIQQSKTIQKISQYIPEENTQYQQIQQKPRARISDYSSEEKESNLGWIILISGILVIIVAIALIIFFRTPITDFFNDLFG